MPTEVARRLKVSRASVWRWQQALAASGRRALRKAPRTGRPPRLSETREKQLVEALEAGALAQGYATDLWTLARVGKLIEKISSKRYSESGVWRLIKRLNFSCQRPSGRASKRDEAAIQHGKKKRRPALKNGAKEGRTIVFDEFIDESGVSERPHRVRAWAPRGKTPVLQYSFTWNQLSAVAGVTFWNISFKLVKGAVRAPEIVAFLKNLKRHLAPRKLLIIWDRLQAIAAARSPAVSRAKAAA